LVFRLSALLGKGLYFAGDVCTIEERPEGVPGIPSDPTGSKHNALCTRPAWYWITMPGAGAWWRCTVCVLFITITMSTPIPSYFCFIFGCYWNWLLALLAATGRRAGPRGPHPPTPRPRVLQDALHYSVRPDCVKEKAIEIKVKGSRFIGHTVSSSSSSSINGGRWRERREDVSSRRNSAQSQSQLFQVLFITPTPPTTPIRPKYPDHLSPCILPYLLHASTGSS